MPKRNLPDYSSFSDEVLIKTLTHLQTRIKAISKELSARFVAPRPAAPTFGWAIIHLQHIDLSSLRATRPRVAPMSGRVALVEISEVQGKEPLNAR